MTKSLQPVARLARQDRALWNRGFLALGMAHFERAMELFEEAGASHPRARVSARLGEVMGAALAAMVAVLIGMALVYRFFPKNDEEQALRATYEAADTGAEVAVEPAPAPEEGVSAASRTGGSSARGSSGS